jgi:hypothetical protein
MGVAGHVELEAAGGDVGAPIPGHAIRRRRFRQRGVEPPFGGGIIGSFGVLAIGPGGEMFWGYCAKLFSSLVESSSQV